MPSIAEMRTNPPKRPQRPYALCTDGTIPVEVMRLDELFRRLDGERRAGRLSDGGDTAEQADIRAKIGEARERMDAATGILTLRATLTNGEWATFTAANPARAEGEPGHDLDLEYAGNRVNVDAVIATLATFAAEWDGEPLEAGDYDRIAVSAAPGDEREMAALVVTMYEVGLDFRQLRADLSTSQGRLNAVASPSASESAANGSSAGNLEPAPTPATKRASASASTRPKRGSK